MQLQVTYFHQPGNVEEGEVEEVSSCLDRCCWGQLCAHNSGNGSCRGLSSSGLRNQYFGLNPCTYQWCIPPYTDSLKVQKQNREPQEYNQSEGCFFDLYKSPRKTQAFCRTARTKETITEPYFYRFSFGKQPSMKVYRSNNAAHTFQIIKHLRMMLNLNIANYANLT